MSSVDDRIVNMQFNNTQFQSGAADSTKSLQTLEQTISGMGKSTGLTTMGSDVDGIRAKFSALQVAGVTALATIVNKAVNAGLALVKSMTLDPLLQGFQEYETNLNSIQTIMANTGKEVKVVNKYLKELNDYSDRTIYSFSQMAENIGRFTAAGVELRTATDAIKGLANTAALSGSNVNQLNTAMYQMSQALSTGTIRLMDWNSLANAGMGGENIRNSLMATAKTLGDHGAAMDAAMLKMGNFRDSLSEGWLTADIFTKTMEVMAGTTNKAGETVAFTAEQLQKMGYAKDAAVELSRLSQAAIDSATKVKTFSQLIDVVKESIGSGWAQVFQNLFGNFNQATKLWTGVSESITGFVSDIFGSVNAMLIGWQKLGGYKDLWGGFANIFKTIGNLIRPFVAAFQSLLPTTTAAGSGLAKVTGAFESITGWMEKMTRNADILTPILAAVFGVFKQISGVASEVFQALSPLIDLIGELAGKLGDLARQGAEISASLIEGILEGLDVGAIRETVENFAMSIVEWIKGALGINSPAAELIPVGTAIVQGILEGITNAIKFVGQAIGKLIGAIMNGISQLFGDMDALDWTAMFNAILTGGFLLAITKLTKSITGFVDNISAPFAEMTNTLKSMQQTLKAQALLDIGIAVGILTASLVALSLIGAKKMAIGLGGLAAMMTLLVTSMLALSKIKPDALLELSFAMVLISNAMVILSTAIAILGNLDLMTLAKGLGAIAAAMVIFVASLRAMQGLGTGLPAAAAAILIMSTAMVVMSAAVAALGNMDMSTLAKGLGAIAVGLTLFTAALVALTAVGPGAAAAGAGIFIVASAMTVMSAAVLALGKMSMSTLAKGLGAIAAGLIMFTTALVVLTAVGPGVASAAAGIVLMSTAMLIMATAIGALGSMGIADIAKGLGALAAGFVVLLAAAAAAVYLAPGLIALGVSVALLGAGVALLGVGLLAAATAFAIFAAAGTAGIAVLMAGFAAFMAMLPQFALQAATSLVVFVDAIAKAAPELRKSFGEIIKSILGTIEDAIPEITSLGIALMGALLRVIRENIPKIGRVFEALVREGLRVIRSLVPDFVDTGVAIILAFLEGIGQKLDRIINAGTVIIVKLIRGIGDSARDIVIAAGDTMMKFLHGIEAWLRDNHEEFITTGKNIAGYLLEGLTFGLLSKENIDKVINAAKNVVSQVVKVFTGPLGFILGSPSRLSRYWGEMIVEGLSIGITSNIKNAVGATVALANATISAGDKVVAKAQREAKKRQIAAEKAAAKARVYDQFAKNAEREAAKAPDNKALEQRAEEARKIADRQAKEADELQRKADAASQKVSDVQQFRAADEVGKADILTARAKELSDRAVKKLAEANAAAQAAKKLRGEEREQILRQAKQDAANAKRLADQSKAASKRANDYNRKSVEERIEALKAEKKAQLEQEKFDNSTDAQKAEILRTRADSAQKRSEAAQKQSEALVKEARKVAKKDAERAQRLLDRAERLAERAQASADEAKQSREEADRYSGQTAGYGTTTNFQLSRSAMEDAASAIDRYTKSLQQAEEAAAAATPIYQFVQNNTSPESLTDTEIYRQTKNLLSASELV